MSLNLIFIAGMFLAFICGFVFGKVDALGIYNKGFRDGATSLYNQLKKEINHE